MILTIIAQRCGASLRCRKESTASGTPYDEMRGLAEQQVVKVLYSSTVLDSSLLLYFFARNLAIGFGQNFSYI